ncbi:hypothetical protein CHH80_22880 [Bacillus sp. 7504-2]|nr:hypothetical protein CHH80_22880 [Bacillus sp. 7504-2]
MTMLKKTLGVVLALILVLSTSMSTVTNASSDLISLEEKYNFQLVEKNEDFVTVKAEYEGDELYATQNLETNEVTMKAVEKPNNLFGFGKDVVTEFEVEVEEISNDYETVSAVAINKETGDKIKLEMGEDEEKVKAQLPALIPVAQWAGAGLLAWLASHAASITIAGVTAYALTKIAKDMKKKNYDYFTAYLDKNKTDVFVGPALKNKSDAIKHIRRGNSETYNVITKTKTQARQLAEASGNIRTYVFHEKHKKLPGYYDHYHPVKDATNYGSYYGNKEITKNHVWWIQ